MKHIITTSAVAILVASFATAAFAGDRKGRGKRMKGDRVMKMLGQLDLSPEQQEAVEKIQQEKSAESEPLRQKIRDIKKQMRAEWTAESPDEKKIIALHEQKHALKGQLAELRIESRIDTLAVLTPEQSEKLAALKAERRSKRAERRANGNSKGKRFGKKGRGPGGKGMSIDPSLDSSSSY